VASRVAVWRGDPRQGFPIESVEYDPPTFHVPGGTPFSQIQVTVTKVHRLQVRASDGTHVYGGIEAPHFDSTRASPTSSFSFLPWPKGKRSLCLTGNSVATNVPPASGSLVLIGNLSSGNDDVNADYTFVTFGASTSFGNGTHTFSVPKHWTEPSTRPGPKQIVASAPGYQITVGGQHTLRQTTAQQ